MSISEARRRAEVAPVGAKQVATAVVATGGAGQVPTAVVAREAAIAAALAVGLALVLSPGGLEFGKGPHPGWIVVLILSARYGSRGLACSFFFLCAALGLASVGLGRGLRPLAAAADSSADVAALGVSVVVAWIGSAHERRIADQTGRAGELARRRAEDATIIGELKDAAVELRARADRLDHSLTFLRDVATRLEGGDRVAAAQAALELAMARTGARAGVVRLVTQAKAPGRMQTVASQGLWTVDRRTPPDVALDRTVQAACETAEPVRAADVDRARRQDSDVAAPIVDEGGTVLGVLALRGVPPDSLRHALVHDVGLIARWFAHASSPRLEAVDGAGSARRQAQERRRRSVSLLVHASGHGPTTEES